MKIYLIIILTLGLNFSISLDKTTNIGEIKFKLKKYSSPEHFKINLNTKKHKEKLSHENLLNRNSIIEIKPNYIITGIKWKKIDNYKKNYLLGVFEGSNDESFMDGTPIAILKEQLLSKNVNYIHLNSSKSYKYIRYIPPNKNNSSIIPLKIFGYKQSSKLKNSDDDEYYYQITNLPLVTIHTEDDIEPNKESDINCYIKIVNEGKLVNNEEAKIKVRGRSSSMVPTKKPYRIKFSTKQKILNFEGKEKKWTLIANYFDRSLLRNNLAFKISELLNFPFTPRCHPVDVVLNGNFRGNYYICDKIEVGNNRVNITKMDKSEIYDPNITGGYLLEIDAMSTFYQGNSFTTDKGIVGNIEYPKEDEITLEQKSYIISKLNQFEDEIYNNNLDSIDLNSYSKYFLVEEFCGDPDHVWSNFYFTKERNDDKFYFGPVWDFDLAFDNDYRLIPTNNKTDFCFYYCSSAGTTKEFLKVLIGNKNVIGYIKKTWEELCNTVLNQNVLVDYIEEVRQYIKDSAELNFLRWDNDEDFTPSSMDFGRDENFEDSVEIVKEYDKGRFASLSNLIDNSTQSLDN